MHVVNIFSKTGSQQFPRQNFTYALLFAQHRQKIAAVKTNQHEYIELQAF
jgi:hypothetical protein